LELHNFNVYNSLLDPPKDLTKDLDQGVTKSSHQTTNNEEEAKPSDKEDKDEDNDTHSQEQEEQDQQIHLTPIIMSATQTISRALASTKTIAGGSNKSGGSILRHIENNL
jgi:hypothetical protein